MLFVSNFFTSLWLHLVLCLPSKCLLWRFLRNQSETVSLKIPVWKIEWIFRLFQKILHFSHFPQKKKFFEKSKIWNFSNSEKLMICAEYTKVLRHIWELFFEVLVLYWNFFCFKKLIWHIYIHIHWQVFQHLSNICCHIYPSICNNDGCYIDIICQITYIKGRRGPFSWSFLPSIRPVIHFSWSFPSIRPVIHPWMASYNNPLQCEGWRTPVVLQFAKS